MPVVEIDKADARPHKHPQRPSLTLWIHAIPVSCRFAAGGDHELIAVKNNKAGGLAFSGFVDAGQSGHTAMQCEKVKSSEPFQNGNALSNTARSSASVIYFDVYGPAEVARPE